MINPIIVSGRHQVYVDFMKENRRKKETPTQSNPETRWGQPKGSRGDESRVFYMYIFVLKLEKKEKEKKKGEVIGPFETFLVPREGSKPFLSKSFNINRLRVGWKRKTSFESFPCFGGVW